MSTSEPLRSYNPSGPASNPPIIAIFGSRVLFGQERANIEVLKSHLASGAKVTVIMRNESWPEVEMLKSVFQRSGFEVIQCQFFDPLLLKWKPTYIFKCLYGLISGSLTVANAVRRRSGSVIYCFNVYYSLTVALYLIFGRPKLIYRAGDEIPTHSFLFRAAWKVTRRRITRLVAISRFMQEKMLLAGVDPSLVSVIYAKPRSLLGSEDPKSAVSLDASTPNILYFGQINQEKGILELEEAFRHLIKKLPCTLTIVGRIDEAWTGDAFARAVRNRLTSDPLTRNLVSFPGYVEDVYRWIDRATVHVQPSTWEEPLGNTVIEAKSRGVPSVVFASGGLPELIQDGIDGTICSIKSGAALAEALLPYLATRSIARERGDAALASLQRLNIPNFDQLWNQALRDASARGFTRR